MPSTRRLFGEIGKGMTRRRSSRLPHSNCHPRNHRQMPVFDTTVKIEGGGTMPVDVIGNECLQAGLLSVIDNKKKKKKPPKQNLVRG